MSRHVPRHGTRHGGPGAGTPVAAGFLLAGAVALLLAACGAPDPGSVPEPGSGTRSRSTAGPPPRPNVIVLLVDTLRADGLGAYGYDRPTSPHLDALAEESFLFEQARAQAPCTFPSVNSFLTGLPPSRFSGQPEGRMGIPEDADSLAEILRRAGYATAAVSASPIVRKNPGQFNPHGGFDPGFDRFVDSCVWNPASVVNDHALAQLDALPEPFFLYLHYMDPHGPYRPPADWPKRFADAGFEGSDAVRRGDPRPLARTIAEALRAGEPLEPGAVPAAAVAHLRNLYDEEIAYFDSQLGRLLGELTARGLDGSTVLVLASDHGEEFFEHGRLKHCNTVFDTEIRTPLLLRLPPGLEPAPPRRIGANAANLDLVPTLLDYLRIEPPAELAGRSLRGAIADAENPVSPSEQPPVVAAWGGQRAATDGRYKLIVRPGAGGGSRRLYDLAADPGETRDLLAGDRPELPADARRAARRLARAIEEWIRTHEA
ncbi:MAG: sulfatase, partial [Acidobacteriota bacterium]